MDNLSFGGTGKTSMVIRIGRYLQTLKIPFAIVTRGYRSVYEKSGIRVSEEHTVLEVGDEAMLFRRNFEGAAIYIGGDRRRSLERVKVDGFRFVIFDDGFQSTHIKKDFHIMLLNPAHPYYYLRNFKFWRKREDLVLNFHKDATALAECKQNEYFFEETGLRDGNNTLQDIGSSPIIAFSGIGDNSRFRATLLQFQLLSFKTFRDHHQYSLSEIENLERLRQKLGAGYLVTTEKDFVRISDSFRSKIPLLYLQNRIRFNESSLEIMIDNAKEKGFIPTQN